MNGNGGMGEWGNGMIITSDYGSFPHSLLSTSNNLDGGIPAPLKKNMISSVGMIVPNIWKNKICSKAPTSNHRFLAVYSIYSAQMMVFHVV